MVKKRQKLIPVPSPLPSPSPSLSPSLLLLLLLLSLATPIEPISVNKGKDKNIEEPIEVKDEDIGSLLLLSPIRFISI